MTTADALPAFDLPPVQEVALGVHFEPLAALRSRHYGDLARMWESDYPTVEDQPALPERPTFQQSHNSPAVQFVNVDPLPRCWFISRGDDLLIQVQRDRLVHNWRKRDTNYPHYADLFPKFVVAWESFSQYAIEAGVGELRPTEVEVSYYNAIEPPDKEFAGALDGVLQPLSGGFSDQGLGTPISSAVTLEYPITESGDTVGRLYVQGGPAEGPTGRVILLNLTARGRPLGGGVDGIGAFMRTGHDVIVRGFASLTTADMHKRWRRTK